MMIRFLCLAFVVVAVSCKPHGAVNKNCCPPQQYEGKIGVRGGAVDGGKSMAVKAYGTFAVDRTAKKTLLVKNEIWGTTTLTMKIIEDFNTKVQYLANMHSQSCTKLNLTMPYEDGCIPSSLLPVGESVMGAGTDTLNIVSYEGPLSATGNVMDVSMTVTKDTCLPVGQTVAGSSNNAEFFDVYGMMNITLGIKDPSIFNVPSFCN